MSPRDVGRRGELDLIVDYWCVQERLCARVVLDGRLVRVGSTNSHCPHAVLEDPEALERLLRWGDAGHRAWARVHEWARDPDELMRWIRALDKAAREYRQDPLLAGDANEALQSA